MTFGFEWSWALIGLVVLPVLLALYLIALRRKRRFPVRYASLGLIQAARPGRSWWRRHASFALLLAAIAALVVALARPEATRSVARSQTSIILALDVSRSMCASDVEPNRLVVAQEAAKEFVDGQPSGIRLGIVAFAASAQVVVAPTTDKDRLRAAVDGLTTSFGTAIGSAILTSIDALSEVNPAIAPSTIDLPGEATPGADYEPDVVVLLTDGANTRGLEPLDAAEQAADRRLRVYTIGFGTEDPVALVCTPEQLGGEAFGPGAGVPGADFGPGGLDASFLTIDEPTLEEVAAVTGGEYARAVDAEQLIEVFRGLPARIERQDETTEISVWFVAGALVLALMALGASWYWNRVS